VGFLRAATGSWTVPVTVLLLICAIELAVGLFAGRPKMLPAGGVTPRPGAPPEADSTPADNYSKLWNRRPFPGVSPLALDAE
jgi:hypothetical protein